MHINAYDVQTDNFHTIDYDRWLENTAVDDERRYKMFKHLCKDKDVLEFGCGNGGFLRRIKRVAKSVVGIELEVEAVRHLNSEGIKAVQSVDELDSKKYDAIVSFMVIEHLVDPFVYLEQLKNLLTDDGIFICTTVNADDALITYYNCNPFQDFTYWSEHVYLYNEDTLVKLLKEVGFKDITCTQVQRYSLANHLFWLNCGKPGGHVKYLEFNDDKLNEEYVRVLRNMKKCDSICVCARKT